MNASSVTSDSSLWIVIFLGNLLQFFFLNSLTIWQSSGMHLLWWRVIPPLIKPVFTETKQRAALVHVALVYGRHGKSSPTWTAVKACGHSAVWIHSIILQSVILVLLLGTFSRRQGQLYMDLTVCNKAMQAMGQFAIQFNKNRSERMRCHKKYIFSLLGEV